MNTDVSDTPTPVIIFGNQKGGVGKTTNTINCAAALGQLGKRVLVIDTDAESCATRGLGINPDEHAGFFEVCTRAFPIERLVLTDKMPKGVHLVPSRPDVIYVPQQIDLSSSDAVYGLLLEPIQRARELYDFILVDTPPNPGSWQALAAYAAGDFIVLSIKTDAYSYDAMVTALQRTVMRIQEKVNERLEVLGVLMSDVDNRSLDWKRNIIEPMTRQGVEHLLFAHRIRKHRLISQCQNEGITLFQVRTRHHKKNRAILEDYEGVVQEMLYRLADLDGYLDRQHLRHSNGYPDDLEPVAEIDRGPEFQSSGTQENSEAAASPTHVSEAVHVAS